MTSQEKPPWTLRALLSFHTSNSIIMDCKTNHIHHIYHFISLIIYRNNLIISFVVFAETTCKYIYIYIYIVNQLLIIFCICSTKLAAIHKNMSRKLIFCSTLMSRFEMNVTFFKTDHTLCLMRCYHLPVPADTGKTLFWLVIKII